MKKLAIAAITLFMTIFTLPVVPMSASAKENNAAGWSGDSSKSMFIDNADLFTESEEEDITEEIQEASEKLELNIIILAAGSDYYMGDEQTERFSDDSYDQTFGEDTDGVFYFMDFTGKQPAYDYISPSGKGMVYYKSHIDDILDEVYYYLPSSDLDPADYTDDIKDAISCFLGQLSEYSNSDSYYYDDYSERYYYYEDDELVITRSKPFKARLKALVFALPIGLIAALIYFFVMKHVYKFKSSANPNVYVSSEDIRFIHREDRFIRTYTTKRKIETSSGGGSRGGGGGGGRGGGRHR